MSDPAGAPALVIGVGTTTGAPIAELQTLVRDVLAAHGLAEHPVAVVATIDRRRDEPAVVALASSFRAQLVSFSREVLASVQWAATPSSASVERAVSVCEPAAILGSGGGSLVVEKVKSAHATVAVATLVVQSGRPGDGRACCARRTRRYD